MTSDLVRIARSMPVPPLSQSRQGDMACSLSYIARHIRDLDVETAAASRGSEIHRLIAQYMDSLGISKLQTDYQKMAELSADASPEAKEVLDKFTEAWFVDTEKIYDTELYIALDEQFNVLVARGKSERRKETPATIAYEGMLDLVLMESETEATIFDWKSYYQIVDADTFQSKFYPLLLFLLNPGLQTIHFKLTFVRYGDATREVTYTRGDVEALKKLAARERRRLIDLHDRPDRYEKASPGRQCTWCPLLLTECPIKDVNDYSTLKPPELVAFAMWMQAAKKQSDTLIKNWLIENGEIEYQDQNGTKYRAWFNPSERRSYPLGSTYDVLMDYGQADEKDARELLANLTVSGLSSPLKAKKRAKLAQRLEPTAIVKTITTLKIGRAGEPDEEENGNLF